MAGPVSFVTGREPGGGRSTRLPVSVLGMGRMGRGIAGRLLDAGHAVTVWNRTSGKAGGLVDRGADERSTPEAATSGATVVLAPLTDDDAVRSVLAPHGRPLALPPDTIVVDCGTVSPATTRFLAATYPGAFVAAPVLGSPEAVASGSATQLVAGPEDLVDRLAPVWSATAARTVRCGDDPARASELKLLNNYLLLAGVATLAEVVATAQRAGIEDGFLEAFLGSSPLVATGLHNRLEQVIGRGGEGWFATPLGAKDMSLALSMAEGMGLRLPLAEAVHQVYRRAADEGLADADIAGVVSLYPR